MKFEFEIFDSDIEDRKKIIEMKEEIRKRIDELSDFGKNTMGRGLVALRERLEYCENEWLQCQRDKAMNRLSEVLNVDRASLKEKYWREDD
jgi:hypothetical protein